MDFIKNINGTVTISLTDFNEMITIEEELKVKYDKLTNELKEEKEKLKEGLVKKVVIERRGLYTPDSYETFYIKEEEALKIISVYENNERELVEKRKEMEMIRYFKNMSILQFIKFKKNL